MFSKKKKNTFLLLELLIGLMILALCIPMCYKSFSALIHLNQSSTFEEILTERIDELFFEIKHELDFETLSELLKNDDHLLAYKTIILNIRNQELPVTLSINKQDEKKDALLLELHLKTIKPQSKAEFSQIYCLKK
ncbi:MAG: hypothetical protein S4CHLAM7_09900 [Chlamydiae bacterium]|nr:hypothetical protein [Chlamydiota bacterium]